MTVYRPECWICKHAMIISGQTEAHRIFIGCEQTYKTEECKYEAPEFRITTSSERKRVHDQL